MTLKVQFGSLDNGAIYPAKVALDAKNKDLTVLVERSGYRKLTP